MQTAANFRRPSAGCTQPQCEGWRKRDREKGETESKGDDAVRELLLMTFSECAGFCCSVDQKGVCCVCERERLQLWQGLLPFTFNAFCFIVLQKHKKKKKRKTRSFIVWLKWIHDSFDFNGKTVHLATAKVFTQKQSNKANKVDKAMSSI